MDTNVIFRLTAVQAANDSAFSGRVLSGDPVPPNLLTIKKESSDVFVRDLAMGLLQAERARVQRKEIAWGGWQIMSNRMDAHLLPLLGDRLARDVDGVAAQELIDRLGEQDFTSTTIAQYMVLLRKTLMHGVLTGVLDEMPRLPKVKIRSQPRGSFSVAEYRRLVATARRLVGQPHPILETLQPGERFWIARELLYMPRELPWLIRWMVNTFVRPSDIKSVRHRHIDIVRGKHVYLRMRLPETKRHSQPMVSLRPAV